MRHLLLSERCQSGQYSNSQGADCRLHIKRKFWPNKGFPSLFQFPLRNVLTWDNPFCWQNLFSIISKKNPGIFGFAGRSVSNFLDLIYSIVRSWWYSRCFSDFGKSLTDGKFRFENWQIICRRWAVWQRSQYLQIVPRYSISHSSRLQLGLIRGRGFVLKWKWKVSMFCKLVCRDIKYWTQYAFHVASDYDLQVLF